MCCVGQTYYVTNTLGTATDFQARDSYAIVTFSATNVSPGAVTSFEGSPSWGVGSFTAGGGGWVVSPFGWQTNIGGGFNIESGGVTFYSFETPVSATTIFVAGFVAFLVFFVAGTHFRLFGRVADA